MYTRDPSLLELNEDILVDSTLLITYNTKDNELINYENVC